MRGEYREYRNSRAADQAKVSLTAIRGHGSFVASTLGFTNTQPTDAREPYHRFKYENPYIRRLEVLLEPGELIFFTPIPMTSCA
jgi:hypothetical protein